MRKNDQRPREQRYKKHFGVFTGRDLGKSDILQENMNLVQFVLDQVTILNLELLTIMPVVELVLIESCNYIV